MRRLGLKYLDDLKINENRHALNKIRPHRIDLEINNYFIFAVASIDNSKSF